MPKLTRREFLAAAGGAVTAATLDRTVLGEAASPRRLNILWLMTDQHTHSVLGCAGNAVAKTPHLDRLAQQGARFTQATCVTPFCSPTRASFLTGLYPHAHGITGNVKNDAPAFQDPCICTEDLLFDRGWAAAQLGKWHLGRQRDLRCYAGAETYGEARKRYQEEYLEPLGEAAMTAGPRPGEVEFRAHFLTEEMAAFRQSAGGGKRVRGELPAAMGRQRVKPEHTLESWLADQCIELMEKHCQQNFMITYSVSPPHAPWVCPEPYYDMYDPAEMPWPKSGDHLPEAYQNATSARWGRSMGEANLREYLRCYYGQVTMMDACIGRILQALRRLGLEDDTLVLYTSDHGDMQAAHHMPGKSVFGFFEEILRVPLIVRAPKHVKPGTVLDCAASSVDIMPTLLDFAGVPIPDGVQGRSLRPCLEGREGAEFEAAFCGRGSGNRGNFGRMVRTAEAKYAYYSDGRRELYDLGRDPHEMNDVADDAAYRPLGEKLHALLRRHADATGDPALAQIPKV